MKQLFCSVCGNFVDQNQVSQTNHNSNTEEDRYICEECFEHNTWCSRCGEYHDNDEFIICDWCGASIPPCQPTYSDSSEEIVICSNCEYEAITCVDCGIFLRDDEVHFIGDDPYCSSCYGAAQDYNSDVIHNYSFKPTLQFYGVGPVYLGVELEIDSGYNRDECARDIEEIANVNGEWKIYTKYDSSLHDGFEIVSMPATLDMHLLEFPWPGIMEIALDYGFRSHDAGTCGLHVHINRTAFGVNLAFQEFGIAKLTYLIELFWGKLVFFSRRTEEQLESWAQSYGLNPVTETPDKLYKKACEDNVSSRYYAVNMQNAETVELRLFRGTLKYLTFAATLQLVQLLVDIANKLDIEAVQSFTWPEFIHAGSKYAELQEYLHIRRLI